MFGQVFKWIDLIDDLTENVVEDIIDTRTATQLSDRIINKATFKLFFVCCNKLLDQGKDERSIINSVERIASHCSDREVCQFLLLISKRSLDLRAEQRDRSLDVVDKDSVQ